MKPSHDSKGSHPAECEAAMCLASDDIGYAALWSLGGENVLSHSFKDILIETEELDNNSDYVRTSEVALSVLVHHEFSSFFYFFEKGIQSLLVKVFEVLLS